jgi:V8-like Glu-specific endopeptidase
VSVKPAAKPAGAATVLPKRSTAPLPPGGHAPVKERVSTTNRAEITRRSITPPARLKAIADTSAHPWASICWLKMTFPNGDQRTGTAFFIGAETLATAAHNVKFNDSRAVRLMISPAFGGVKNPDWVRASVEYVPPGWSPQGSRDDDWAVLSVGRGAIKHRVGQFALSDMDTMPDSDNIYVCGYSNSYKPRTQYFAGGELADSSPTLFHYRFPVTDGMSGGPLFYRHKGSEQRIAIGIHGGEWGGRGVARRISGAVYNKLRQYR